MRGRCDFGDVEWGCGDGDGDGDDMKIGLTIPANGPRGVNNPHPAGEKTRNGAPNERVGWRERRQVNHPDYIQKRTRERGTSCVACTHHLF